MELEDCKFKASLDCAASVCGACRGCHGCQSYTTGPAGPSPVHLEEELCALGETGYWGWGGIQKRLLDRGARQSPGPQEGGESSTWHCGMSQDPPLSSIKACTPTPRFGVARGMGRRIVNHIPVSSLNLSCLFAFGFWFFETGSRVAQTGLKLCIAHCDFKPHISANLRAALQVWTATQVCEPTKIQSLALNPCSTTSLGGDL